MTLFASYAGSRVTAGRITTSASGAWVGDLMLADDSDVPTRGTLTIADLTLVGAVTRGGPFAGSRALRLVGGAGGWRNELPALPYAKPQGVRLATVLGDAAAAVGERVVLSAAYATRVLGVAWVRARMPASQVLALTVGRAWWVDPAGVTQVGDRPTSAVIASGFTVTNYQHNLGLVTIATETLAPWQPGATFRDVLLGTAPLTASSVTIALDPRGKLRLEVLTT